MKYQSPALGISSVLICIINGAKFHSTSFYHGDQWSYFDWIANNLILN